MKRLFLYLISIATITALFLTGCNDSAILKDNIPPPDSQIMPQPGMASDSGKVAENRYIVTFKDQPTGIASAQAAQQALEATSNVLTASSIPQDSVIHRYQWASFGFAGRFTTKQVERLRNHPLVDHVAKDFYYKAIEEASTPIFPTITSITASFSQTTPWGVNRVNAPLDGTGKTAWILDTGIDLNHPDLNVDVQNSVSFVAQEPADDYAGHGTHVAGIIGAIDNSQDVVGVAAGANVVAVKVCDGMGGCWASDVKAGVDYVANNFDSGDVANISLGYPEDCRNYPPETYGCDIPLSDMENSIINAANSGLKFTISAGNDSDNANNYSPARIENTNVWTVSAYDGNDDFASFSNYGNPPIEYGGPGVNIPSLAIGGGITNKTGTSMSAPHLAGLLLADPAGLDTHGTVNGDPDSTPDFIAVHDLPISVYFTGPAVLDRGQQGMYEAVISHADATINYQWYYRQTSSDPWTTGGTNSDTFYHTFYQNSHTAGIKVEVTSAGEQSSSTRTIQVNDPGCNPGEICQ